MSAAMPASQKQLTVWNWHGDTNAYGEMEPRIIYDGPEQDYDAGRDGKKA